ncbi:MAG: ATP-binding protein [Planctomycetota bacterium]|nr:ATP-binding protein [Phycisphaerales bacterium]
MQPAATNHVPQSPPEVVLRMVSDFRYLAGAREMVAGTAKRFGFSHDSSSHLALAVDEALCNVIRHGYKQAPGHPIWIKIWPLEDDGQLGPGLCIVIEDEAEQIDPSAIQGRDLDDIRPGGLGVHIIRQVVDEAQYAAREEAGMRLTLVKRTNGPSAQRTRELTNRCAENTSCDGLPPSADASADHDRRTGA